MAAALLRNARLVSSGAVKRARRLKGAKCTHFEWKLHMALTRIEVPQAALVARAIKEWGIWIRQ